MCVYIYIHAHVKYYTLYLTINIYEYSLKHPWAPRATPGCSREQWRHLGRLRLQLDVRQMPQAAAGAIRGQLSPAEGAWEAWEA